MPGKEVINQRNDQDAHDSSGGAVKQFRCETLSTGQLSVVHSTNLDFIEEGSLDVCTHNRLV